MRRPAPKLLAGVYQPTAQSPSSWYTDRRRLGITSSVQYHPGDNFKLDVDFLYGRLWDHRDDYAMATAGQQSRSPAPAIKAGPRSSVVRRDRRHQHAACGRAITGIDLRSEHHIVKNHTDFYQGVANLELEDR